MRAADLDDIMEIERLSFPNPWGRQIFIEELEREWAHLRVVRDEGRVVAFCNYWVVRDEVHLLNVAVHPDQRGKGHAAHNELRHDTHSRIRYTTNTRCTVADAPVRGCHAAATAQAEKTSCAYLARLH